MVKSVKNAVEKEMMKDMKKAQVVAQKEITKVKKEFGKAVKQAEQYVAKHPEKATAIAPVSVRPSEPVSPLSSLGTSGRSKGGKNIECRIENVE